MLMVEKQYWVYILTNRSKTLYIGITNNLPRRVWEHKNKQVDGFTQKYHIDQLVYYEETGNVMSALEREKQLKKWRREKKVALIHQKNPDWLDLAYEL